ncbi:MAG TPA: serine protease [Caulobacteraceae bacterium]|jgi:S1-C subfamily serine protease
MKRLGAILLVVLCVGAGGHVAAADQPATTPDARPQRVALTKIISSIQNGTPWATFKRQGKGLFDVECFVPQGQSDKLIWRSDSSAIDRRKYLATFAEELKSAGLSPADDPDNLFQKDRGDAQIQVAANIKHITASLCLGHLPGGMVSFRIGGSGAQPRPPPPLKPDFDGIYGDVAFDIDWQVYSRAADKVVADVEVSSNFSTTGHQAGNYDRLILGGLRENMKKLLASPEFRSAISGASSRQAFQPDGQPMIVMAAAKPSKPMPISDAVGSVMVIFSSGGHGSGFLVSSDGYVVTAAHVVGSDKFLKIRWSDGLEGVGEVVRTDKRRDVALIKTDPRGRQPLALRREAPQPGDTVFAIGAPIDPKLQNTVTRGVVSANRIMDGFSFIQSDVTVDPGNSGGPLLDEQGRVLGFTDKGLRSAEAPTGLNFFVPIDDALRFLAAEPQ